MTGGGHAPPRSRRRILLFLLIVAIGAPLLAIVVGEVGVGRAMERRLYDGWFAIRGPLPRPDEVVVVAIDLDSEQALGRYPWSRDWHTQLVRNLHRAGASVIAFDATFADAFPDQDPALRAALDETGIAILGAKAVVINTRGAIGQRLEEPVPELRGVPIGIVNIGLDAADAIVREYPITREFSQGVVPQLGVVAVLRHLGLPDDALEFTATGWRIGEREIPRGPDGGMLINYLGPSSSVSTYSYMDIVDDAETWIGDEWDLDIFEDYLDEGRFEGKIVFVGSTVPEHQDLHPTPFRANGDITAGVEIHAHAVQTILSGNFIRALPRTIQWGWTILLALLITALASRVRGAWGIAMALGLGALTLAISGHLFVREGIWLWNFAPLLSVGFSYAGSTAALYLAEEEEKARIRGMFQQYVAASVVDELIANPQLLALGGEERVLSVLFCDVAGFSTISEGLTPTALVELLNEYLTAMTEIILEEGGIIDKYQGDAIMAEFGAPVPLPDHAERACRAALRMTRELARLRTEVWSKTGKPLLEARVGINTGEMLVGNLGSRRIMDYTVMGDQVNLASRLEGTNKVYGTEIMVSEFTWDAVKDAMVGRELDRIRVKGKNEPVGVYEVLATRAEGISPETARLLERFASALALYRAKRFGQAREAFAALAAEYPQDGPTALYLERCTEYLEDPPAEDWDGVFTMKTK